MPPRKKKAESPPGGDHPAVSRQFKLAGWTEGDWLLLDRGPGQEPIPGKVSQIRDQGGEIWLTYLPHIWSVAGNGWVPIHGTAHQARVDAGNIRRIIAPTQPNKFECGPPIGATDSAGGPAALKADALPDPEQGATEAKTVAAVESQGPPVLVAEAIVKPTPIIPAASHASGDGAASGRALNVAIEHLAQDAGWAVVEVRSKLDELACRVTGLEVESDETLELAVDLVREIKATGDKSEAVRKRFTVPLDNAKKSIQAIFNPIKEGLEGIRSTADQKIVDFRRRRQAEQEASARAAQDAFSSMSFEDAMRMADECDDPEKARKIRAAAIDRRNQLTVAPAYVPPAPAAAGMSVRNVWKFEILDIRAVAAEVASGRLPAEVIEVNSTAVRGLIQAGWRAIPGLRVYSQESVAVR